MPNWCDVEMAISGSVAELKDFRKKWEKAYEEADKNHTWGTYEIYRMFGYQKEEILDENSGNGYIRGTLCQVSNVAECLNGKGFLIVSYEAAWRPMNKGFDWLFKKHYKTLSQVYVAEECGEEIYINTDEKGIFFPEKAFVDDENDGITTFTSVDEAVAYFRDKYVKDEHKGTITNVEDCIDYCNDWLEGVWFRVYSKE